MRSKLKSKVQILIVWRSQRHERHASILHSDSFMHAWLDGVDLHAWLAGVYLGMGLTQSSAEDLEAVGVQSL